MIRLLAALQHLAAAYNRRQQSRADARAAEERRIARNRNWH